MPTLIVVNNPDNWPLAVPGVDLVAARTYLTDPSYNDLKSAKVFNLCRSYAYQDLGYYVSLLAEARGHRPVPNVATIQDMKSPALARVLTWDIEEVIHQSLKPIQSRDFTLSIYFGRSLAKRYDRLARQLFNLFQAPLLRAYFMRDEGEDWVLSSIGPIPASEIPESHREFVIKAATEYFAHRGHRPRATQNPRYDMAILYDPEERLAPSDDKAIDRFEKAANKLGISTELITRDDFGRLAEFDALFIRMTTQVNHFTYRFARRAAAEGLVVIDDPVSISRCTNKVYLAELMDHHDIPTPKTLIVHRDNVDKVAPTLGLPCVLKQPDSSFSQGVIKVHDEAQLERELDRFLEDSELVVAQEFLPTDFDWRVGVLDKKPLYVCKYHMAKNHWQIVRRDARGETFYGKVDTLSVEEAPKKVVDLALKAANTIGDGLYGVDLKQSGDRIYVIEVNDNPNINTGYEDRVLKQELYDHIMNVFLQRLERIREGTPRREPRSKAT